MSLQTSSFFTSVGCMDGRVQAAIAQFGKEEFGAEFPDTITDAGLDGKVGKGDDQLMLDSLAKKIFISIDKHNSKGIIVHGHEDCSGNPVDEELHKQDIKASVAQIEKMLVPRNIPVVGVFVKVNPRITAEKI